MRNLNEILCKAEAIDHVENLSMAQRMTLCEAPLSWFGSRNKG
jgi:hypothetical protein